MKTLVSLMAVAGLATAASAQLYEGGTGAIAFEVFNGTSWVNSVNVNPGARVEWRVRVSYSGDGEDTAPGSLSGAVVHKMPIALGEAIWQGIFGGVDNTGAGAAADQLDGWRNGGTNGTGIAGSLVSTTNGNTGTNLAGAYGRVNPFGLAAMQASNSNILTTFRESTGTNGAPAGEWLRVSGSGSVWGPTVAATAAGTNAANTTNMLRQIQSSQVSEAQSNPLNLPGLSVVVFRGAFIASDDTALRTVTLNTDERFLRRAGGDTSNDNRRYIAWQTAANDTGTGTNNDIDLGGVADDDTTWGAGNVSIRTFNNVLTGASINIVPTPASLALMGLGGLVAARRRRA